MNKVKKKNVLLSDTVYTLFLYVLFYYEKLDETLFIFSDGIPEKVRKKFPDHIYVPSGKGSKFSFLIRLLSIFKLRNLNLKNYEQFGQDHLFYSFVYININFTLIEDGTINYQPNNRNGLYSRFKSPFLKGKEFGYNKKVNKIILTSKDNLPIELLSKIEVKDIYSSWNEKNIDQKQSIENIFCLNFKVENMGSVLLTQYFSELGIMTETDKINMYKQILLKYEHAHDIYIKPHPKEDTNYSDFFENKIIPSEVPFQLIELASGGIDTVITCSSSVGLNTKANVIYHDQNDFVRNKND